MMYMYFFFQLFSKPGKIIIFEYNYNYIIQYVLLLLFFFFSSINSDLLLPDWQHCQKIAKKKEGSSQGHW